jgi:hypothetical protein
MSKQGERERDTICLETFKEFYKRFELMLEFVYNMEENFPSSKNPIKSYVFFPFESIPLFSLHNSFVSKDPFVCEESSLNV